jgi:hypothetical protein
MRYVTEVQTIPALDPLSGALSEWIQALRLLAVKSGLPNPRVANGRLAHITSEVEIAVKRGCFRTLLFHAKTLQLLESTTPHAIYRL